MTSATGQAIRVGDPAPDFTLTDRDGVPRRLADLRMRDGQPAPAVLFFYPGNFTPACTREACTFRDSYEEFVDAGAVVIGISPDSPDSHRRFASAMRLPYTLLADTEGVARQLYGVPKTFGVLRGRVTYVIDAAGIVRLVFNSPLRPATHVRKAIDLIRTLKA